MPTIRASYESKRGCGWRKPGGLYLMTDGPVRRCGLMPLPLDRCPTCDHGVKPSRGWTWIDAGTLFAQEDPQCGRPQCGDCPVAEPRRLTLGKAGLLWIGSKFYPTPREFMAETLAMGMSRRIAAIPKDFKVGQTWLFLAHQKAIEIERAPEAGELLTPKTDYRAGIVYVAKPTRIEYVIKGDETQAELEALEQRGLSLVRVVRVEATPAPGPDDQDDLIH